MFSARITSNFNTNKTPFAFQKRSNNSISSHASNENTVDKKATRSDMRELLRGLNKESQADYKVVNGKKIFSDTSKDKANGFLQVAGAAIDKKLEAIKSKPKYRYKEVSAKIRAAKNSVSAGQALIAAKRNVSEIKRQLSSSKEESDELQLALSHAKRMEMAVRKKKRHLETEEFVENARKHEAELESNKDRGIAEQEIRSAIVDNAEGKLEDMEDEILEEREALSEELSESIKESSEISEETMSELNSMISEFGEEELKQLEENMEMLESLEVVDPHMSEEDFKRLKTKHRASEEKSLVKADMEYLKGMIKLTENATPNMGGTTDIASNTTFEVVV